jgi:Cu/Ag efflux protein CusF
MKHSVVLISSLVLLVPGVATRAAEPAMAPASVVGEVIRVTATVEAVDLATRQVTLRDTASGDTVTFIASEEVRNLPQVHKGDIVEMDLYESLALALEPESTQKRMREDKLAVSRAALGQKPGGTMTRTVEAVASVEAVNLEKRLVTVRGAKQTVTLKAGDDIDLSALKVGDRVRANYIESFSISVKPGPRP